MIKTHKLFNILIDSNYGRFMKFLWITRETFRHIDKYFMKIKNSEERTKNPSYYKPCL